jgi:DNA end-binding protein Ku
MRAMWKGSVAFGLVNVPIKLYAATEDHDVRFHQVHAADGGRIKMTRTCSIDGEKVEYKDVAKAYETETGQVVVMEESDFDGLPVPGVREIEVLEFVPSEQVDPVLFDRSYYLEPEARAVKPYVLLREALLQTERTAIVRVVLRSKSQLAALRVREGVLVLQTMLWPDEVRAADFDVLESDVDVREQELAMAASLVDNLSMDFEPEKYHDDYREALLAVIEGKLAGGQGVTAPAASENDEPGDGIVVDLMAALRESVERSKAERAGETVEKPAEKPVAVAAVAKKAPAKKAAAKKAPAKKSATKATAAKKTATKAAEKDAEPAKRRRTA